MRQLRLNPSLVLGALLALGLVVVLILPSVVHFERMDQQQLVFEINGELKRAPLPPGEAGFLLGTDPAGRDFLPRLILGARMTLLLGLSIVLGRALLGIPLGLFAGWRQGWVARLITAASTGSNALPMLVLTVLVLGLAFRLIRAPGYVTYIGVLVLLGVPRLADQVRVLAREVAVQPHVEAAVSLGASTWRIIWKHILPIIRGNLIVALAAESAWVMVIMGQLAIFDVFIGPMSSVERGPASIPARIELVPEWGLMFGIYRDFIRSHWWMPVYPAIALGLVVACFQLLAEGIRLRWIRKG